MEIADFKKSIDEILNENYDNTLLSNFTKKGNPKPLKTIEKEKAPKVKKEWKLTKNTKKQEEEPVSEKSESEEEFSGEGSSSNEDIPLCEEDDESYEPVAKPDVVVPTWQSLRNRKKIVYD